MNSPVINSEGILESNSSVGAVNVSWSPTVGSFDLDHFTVHLFMNETEEIDSRNVSDTHAIFSTVPVDTKIRAKITTSSVCNIPPSNGVFTNMIVVSGGKCCYVHTANLYTCT